MVFVTMADYEDAIMGLNFIYCSRFQVHMNILCHVYEIFMLWKMRCFSLESVGGTNYAFNSCIRNRKCSNAPEINCSAELAWSSPTS